MIEVSAPQVLQLASAHRIICSIRGRFSGSDRRPGCGLRSAEGFVEVVHGALRLPLLRPWRWAQLRPAAPTADCLTFRCTDPKAGCAAAAAALRALESSAVPIPTRVPASQCAPVDRGPP